MTETAYVRKQTRTSRWGKEQAFHKNSGSSQDEPADTCSRMAVWGLPHLVVSRALLALQSGGAITWPACTRFARWLLLQLQHRRLPLLRQREKPLKS